MTPPEAVTSVNGRTGAVVLDASSVGAVPATSAGYRQVAESAELRAAMETTVGAIDVRSKGALLDGVANDTPAINAAFVAAEAFGLSVFQPAGVARIAAQIIPRSGVTWVGQGARSVITATTDFGGAAVGQPPGPLEDFTIRDITFIGGAEDLDIPMRRDRPARPSFPQAVRIIGDRYNGVVPGDDRIYPRVRNITLDGVRILNTFSLPIYLAGVADVKVTNCFFRNTMDAGFVYVDGVDFSHNRVENSADNGVSVSRRCSRATVSHNIISGSAHYGVWCAGFVTDADGGLRDPGPEGFTVSGNVITESGRGGIALSDAPKLGTITGNTVIGVYNGPVDYPDVNAGIGIQITGYPLSATTPTERAAGLLITGNVLKDCHRVGVNVRGAVDVQILSNTFIDIGVSTFIADSSGGITAGSPISADSFSYNCGIITSGTGLERLTAADNTFVDTRATPVSNFAIPSNVRRSPGFVERDNRQHRYRQPLGVTSPAFGESEVAGFTLSIDAAAGSNRDIRFMTAGVDRWVLRADTGDDFVLSRRDAGGALVDYPLRVGRADGDVQLGARSFHRIGFFGAAPAARPSLTYSRAAETTAETQLRQALAALGLVADNTVP